MTIEPKVWNFPTFPIAKQLFYVPGSVIDGGFTSGGARISTPEPGGIGFLDIQPSLQVTEFDFPLSSWLMSKTNGQILKVQLVGTPQIARSISQQEPWGAENIYPDAPWSNGAEWVGELAAEFLGASLPGSNVCTIDMVSLGPVLKHGHVIGHMSSTYLVDDIEYSVEGIATITVTPPLRRAIAPGDTVYFKPFFTGQIGNPDAVRTTYDAVNNGHIQMPMITLVEVII